MFALVRKPVGLTGSSSHLGGREPAGHTGGVTAESADGGAAEARVHHRHHHGRRRAGVFAQPETV
jgi:hypothetical protein